LRRGFHPSWREPLPADTHRKPMLLFLLSAVFLLRSEQRRLFVLLFHEPPRSTRNSVSTCLLHQPWDAGFAVASGG